MRLFGGLHYTTTRASSMLLASLAVQQVSFGSSGGSREDLWGSGFRGFGVWRI